jgi:hypothetical protein
MLTFKFCLKFNLFSKIKLMYHEWLHTILPKDSKKGSHPLTHAHLKKEIKIEKKKEGREGERKGDREREREREKGFL